MAHTKVKLIKEAFIALSICGFAEIIAGTLLSRFESYLILLPGLLVMIPPTIGLRGNVYGAFGSKLTTALHLGSIDVALRNNRKLLDFSRITMGEAVLLGYIIPMISLVFIYHQNNIINYISVFMFVMSFSSFVSGIVMTLSTVVVVIISYKYGIDPDNVSSPFITTIGDVITIPIIFLAVIIYHIIPFLLALGFTIAFALLIPILYNIKDRKIRMGYIKERLPVMILCVFISTVAGATLQHNLHNILLGTIFLALTPLFNALGGSAGAINASRISTAYYLGTIDLNFRGIRQLYKDVIPLDIATTITFLTSATVLLVIAHITGINYPNTLVYYLFVIVASQIIVFIAFTIGFIVVSFSVKLGIDIDHVSIPLITSFMDLSASTVLIALVTIL